MSLTEDEERLVARLRPTSEESAYHRLNPTTKAVIATVASLAAFVIGGYVGPLVVIGIVVASAAAAGVLRRLVRISLLFTLPIGISAVVVNVFFRPQGTVLVPLGPLQITAEGLDFAGQVLVRLFAISLAIGLFTLTTNPRALVLDLQRRGLSSRFAFVALATIEAVPGMVERAATIQAAQRARGLDTEGSVGRRVRGVLPLVAPVLLSSITDVEHRTLALETRAFSRPGRRAALWTLPDTAGQRMVRWGLLVVLAALVVLRLAGALEALP